MSNSTEAAKQKSSAIVVPETNQNEAAGGSSGKRDANGSHQQAIFGLTQDEHHKLETSGLENEHPDARPQYVLSPTSDFKKKWDIAQAFILFYLSIIVPIRVGFSIQATGFGYLVDLIVDVYFWLDIAVNFRSGFEDTTTGRVVYDLAEIRKQYLATWFTLDFIASLPIDLVFRLNDGTFVCSIESFSTNMCPAKKTSLERADGANQGQLFRLLKLFRLVRLVKMLRLIRLQRLLEKYQDELFDLMPTIKMCKLVFILILLGHIFGCFFYFFSTDEYRYESEKNDIQQERITPWLHAEFGQEEYDYHTNEDAIAEAMLGKKYIASMYWAFTTMTTVGYGDISARTMSERIFAMLGMLVGGFVFSGLIGTISRLFESRDLSKLAKHRRIDLVSAFVRDSAMPKVLRLQVLGFFRKQDVRAYDERVFLQQMPYQIRHDVLRHCHGDLIRDVPIFHGASDVFITEVLFCLDPKTFVAGVMITQKGEVGAEMYLLANGDVELLADDQSTVLKVLPAGSYFGEEVCLGHAERQLNVRAKTNCRVCCLAKDDLNPLLDQWPEIRENVQSWYDKRMENFVAEADADTPHGSPSKLRKGTAKSVSKDEGKGGNVEGRLASLEQEVQNMGATLQNINQLLVKMDAKLDNEGSIKA